MLKNLIVYFYVLALTLLVAACGTGSTTTSSYQQSKDSTSYTNTNWSTIVQQAKGSTVNLMMWQGDPYINRYINSYITPMLKEQHDINLNVLSGQGSQVVSLLMKEQEAQKKSSEIDMMWINGETFFQLRQIDALFGPFTQLLPNSQYINFDNPFIGIDFQQPIDGMECPWGNVQLAIIYDSQQISQPPTTLQALSEYVQQHPGTFTIGNDFTGMTLLKSWLIAIAGGSESLQGDFNEAKYQQYSQQLWNYINKNKQYWWRDGKAFPESIASMHQMFANGELHFTMSNNDGEVDNKILLGTFPKTARAYVFDTGTIQNSHYMGIAKQAPNKAGAMVVINTLISPEAQWHKLQPDVWGDGTVLNINKLPQEWQDKFNNIPTRKYAPKRSDIQSKALMELAPEYMIRLFQDFRVKVIQ